MSRSRGSIPSTLTFFSLRSHENEAPQSYFEHVYRRLASLNRVRPWVSPAWNRVPSVVPLARPSSTALDVVYLRRSGLVVTAAAAWDDPRKRRWIFSLGSFLPLQRGTSSQLRISCLTILRIPLLLCHREAFHYACVSVCACVCLCLWTAEHARARTNALQTGKKRKNKKNEGMHSERIRGIFRVLSKLCKRQILVGVSFYCYNIFQVYRSLCSTCLPVLFVFVVYCHGAHRL